MAVETTTQIILNRIEFQKFMIRADHWICCTNCLHFNKDEICELFKARPPAHIIASGCKDHLDDIPF